MMMKMMVKRLSSLVIMIAGCAPLGGCVVGNLLGGMAQNYEYQKEIEVLPQYDLEGKSVAVLVDADMATLYEYPSLVAAITGGVSGRLVTNVPELAQKVVNPDAVLQWQYQTPQWNAMPYGDLAEALNVDRVIYIDIYEYRLNPPGNRWEWEGVCAASIGIIERDGFDADSFAESFNVVATFPPVKALDRSNSSPSLIQQGVLSEFIKKTSWLFYTHIEPKYPDKYQGDLD